MRQQTDELRALIRGVGLRATPSRIAVLSLLREAAQPMSHGEVAEHMADEVWDRATIYRNLIDMSDAGLLRRSDMGDHVWRFEATTGNHNSKEHPHFVCTECGTIECLPEIEFKLQARKRAPRALRKREIEVQVRGLCDNCY
ncbi:MAG: transcriptional repressor [Proteobacteria bacterium]|nr:transcriptional repressor [Pseudomonadota bacterium]